MDSLALKLVTLREEAFSKFESYRKQMAATSYAEFPAGTTIQPLELPSHTVAHALAHVDEGLVIWVRLADSAQSDSRLARLKDLNTDDLVKLLRVIESAQMLKSQQVGAK